MLVDENGAVWFRQSWLDTALRCAERGRLALVKPEWDEALNDAALIGTATHSAIQWCLEEGCDFEAIGQVAYDSAIALCETSDVRWTKWTLPGQLAEHARRCAEAWYREIRPSVPLGGRCEVEFEVPLFESRGRQVGIKGMTDYIGPDLVIRDWKTASKKYAQREKQRANIQSTVYATAANHGAFGPGYRWPVIFEFCVMVRGEASATTQVVDVQRVHAHELWLLDLIQGYMDLAEGVGVQRSWPRNDDHYLCNEQWCPWWSMCKGARLSTAENTWVGPHRG